MDISNLQQFVSHDKPNNVIRKITPNLWKNNKVRLCQEKWYKKSLQKRFQSFSDDAIFTKKSNHARSKKSKEEGDRRAWKDCFDFQQVLSSTRFALVFCFSLSFPIVCIPGACTRDATVWFRLECCFSITRNYSDLFEKLNVLAQTAFLDKLSLNRDSKGGKFNYW